MTSSSETFDAKIFQGKISEKSAWVDLQGSSGHPDPRGENVYMFITSYDRSGNNLDLGQIVREGGNRRRKRNRHLPYFDYAPTSKPVSNSIFSTSTTQQLSKKHLCRPDLDEIFPTTRLSVAHQYCSF